MHVIRSGSSRTERIVIRVARARPPAQIIRQVHAEVNRVAWLYGSYPSGSLPNILGTDSER